MNLTGRSLGGDGFVRVLGGRDNYYEWSFCREIAQSSMNWDFFAFVLFPVPKIISIDRKLHTKGKTLLPCPINVHFSPELMNSPNIIANNYWVEKNNPNGAISAHFCWYVDWELKHINEHLFCTRNPPMMRFLVGEELFLLIRISVISTGRNWKSTST